MTKNELEKLAGKYQAKADRAGVIYQETGMQRYYRDYQNNEDMADALRMAAKASEEHRKMLSLQSALALLAGRVQQGEPPEDIVSMLMGYARLYGLIGRDVDWDSLKKGGAGNE